MRTLIIAVGLVLALPSLAQADDPSAEQAPTSDEVLGDLPSWNKTKEAKDGKKELRKKTKKERDPTKPVYAWFAIPVVGANSKDGFGFGAMGQITMRPPGMDFGFRWMSGLDAYTNVRFDYMAFNGRFEYYGERDSYAVKVTFRNQTDFAYAGPGGANVSHFDPALENGNAFMGGDFTGSYARRVGETPLSLYGVYYARLTEVEALTGGYMDTKQALGRNGGFYTDLTVGAEYRDVDRWPRPIEGHRFELAARGGVSQTDGDGAGVPANVTGIFGFTASAVRWQPLFKDRIVLGIRGSWDKTVGQRPLHDQGRMGNRFRDDLGKDKYFTGYGAWRTIGDGFAAFLTELRFFLGEVDKPAFPVMFMASAFVEEAWLFDDWDPGPHMPTVGASFELIYKRSLVLRPYWAWGWLSKPEHPNDRKASLMFAFSMMGPL